MNNEYFAIIMELCDNSLSQLLTSKLLKDKKGFNINEIEEIMTQLNSGFKIMNKKKIMHRDLKLENILIKYNDNEHKNYSIKITDYGSSKKLKSLSKFSFTKNVGTVCYMAPEILKNEPHNYKCDLWSIGIIIYRLHFGVFPFPGVNEVALLNNINQFGKFLLKKTGDESL